MRRVVMVVAALGVLGVISSGLMIPSKWHVQRSVVMRARSELLYPLISDLKQWPRWCAWADPMKQTIWTYSGSDSGVGAVMSFQDKGRLGDVTFTLVQADPAKGIAYDTVVQGRTPAHGTIAFSEEPGGGTRVTWTDECDVGMNPVARYFIPVIERQLTEEFDIGLRRLKALVEATQANPGEAR